MTLSESSQNDRFARTAGAEIPDIRPGYAKARMEAVPARIDASGVCQGGILFTLANLALAAAAHSHAQVTLSSSANIDFLKTVSAGRPCAEAREVHLPCIPHTEVRTCQADGDSADILDSAVYWKKDRLPVDNPTDTEQP